MDLETVSRIYDKAVGDVREIMDRLYYQCYGVNSISQTISSDFSINSISYSDFLNYARKAYNVSVVDVSTTTNHSRILLATTSVLSTIWADNFGSILPNTPS